MGIAFGLVTRTKKHTSILALYPFSVLLLTPGVLKDTGSGPPEYRKVLWGEERVVEHFRLILRISNKRS